MQGAVARTVGGLHEIVLDGPQAVCIAQEYAGVRLWGAERESQCAQCHGREYTAVYDAPSGIGFVAVGVGVQHHDVALAEVGRLQVGVLADGQRELFHPSFVPLGRADEAQPVADVAFREFLFQRVVPLGGIAVFARAVAHLAVEVFAADELHHAAVVGAFDGIGGVQGG